MCSSKIQLHCDKHFYSLKLLFSCHADFILKIKTLVHLQCQNTSVVTLSPQLSHLPGCQQKCVGCVVFQCEDPQHVGVHRNMRKKGVGRIGFTLQVTVHDLAVHYLCLVYGWSCVSAHGLLNTPRCPKQWKETQKIELLIEVCVSSIKLLC